MKLSPFMIVFVLALVTMGCVENEQYVVREPPTKWSPEVLNNVVRGEIAVGMTKEQAREALERNSGIRDLRTDCWVYINEGIKGVDERAKTEVILTFKDNVLVDRSVRVIRQHMDE